MGNRAAVREGIEPLRLKKTSTSRRLCCAAHTVNRNTHSPLPQNNAWNGHLRGGRSWHNRRVERLLPFIDIPAYLAVYLYCLWKHRPGWQYSTGMVVAGIGFALWLIARAQLGNSFAVKPEARRLVTTGLYSKVRNPIYFFNLLGTIAMCFAMRWYFYGGLAVIFVIWFQWRRAKAEAAVLEAAFGEQYRNYRAQTWF
jgi:protein-S-isoprenylcysteine O-methyltransferase Ste14